MPDPSRPAGFGSDRWKFFNFFDFGDGSGDEKSVRQGMTMDQISDELVTLTGGWPKRVGDQLFGPGPDYQPLWLDSTAKLFAWIARQAKVVWASRGGAMVSQEWFYAHLQMTAEKYDAVEAVPHWPPLPQTYYLFRPLPFSDGSYLEELLSRLRPASSVDAGLLKAFFLSLLWGGKPGSRPAWLFTGPDDDLQRGRGIGKSTCVELAGALVGGFLEVSPQEDIAAIKKRLLSPEARPLRIARLDNIKTHRFSWGDLEALITSPVISGHQLYTGEARRPNTLTWVLTLNGASLSSDLAQRCVIVRLARPRPDPEWERQTRAFIEAYRWEIINDIMLALQAEE